MRCSPRCSDLLSGSDRGPGARASPWHGFEFRSWLRGSCPFVFSRICEVVVGAGRPPLRWASSFQRYSVSGYTGQGRESPKDSQRSGFSRRRGGDSVSAGLYLGNKVPSGASSSGLGTPARWSGGGASRRSLVPGDGSWSSGLGSSMRPPFRRLTGNAGLTSRDVADRVRLADHVGTEWNGVSKQGECETAHEHHSLSDGVHLNH